jgi:hypothetical protein
MPSCTSLFTHEVYFTVSDNGTCANRDNQIEYTVNGSSYTVTPSLPWTSPTYDADSGTRASIYACEGCNNRTTLRIYEDGDVLVSNNSAVCGLRLEGTI